MILAQLLEILASKNWFSTAQKNTSFLCGSFVGSTNQIVCQRDVGARVRSHLNTAVRRWGGGEDDGEYCNKSEVEISENGKMFMLNSDFFQVLKYR